MFPIGLGEKTLLPSVLSTIFMFFLNVIKLYTSFNNPTCSLQDVLLFAAAILKLALKCMSLMAVCTNTMCCLLYDFFKKFQPLTLQGGCITKLEQFLADHLLVIGAVGIGVACLQVRKYDKGQSC